MSKRVKTKEHENLTPTNIRKVISLLNPADKTKAISKKEACEILNISYNTTRLDKIIESHLEREDYIKKRREQKRGKPVEEYELKEILTQYLSGVPIANIASSQYRSVAFIKNIVEKIGVPERPTRAEDKKRVAFLPEQCVKDSFEKGEIVWCALYHCPAIIEHELSVDYQAEKPGFIDTNYEKKYGSKCYSIRVLEHSESDFGVGGFYAYALAYDLGSLSHIKQYGIDPTKL